MPFSESDVRLISRIMEMNMESMERTGSPVFGAKTVLKAIQISLEHVIQEKNQEIIEAKLDMLREHGDESSGTFRAIESLEKRLYEYASKDHD